MRSPCFPIGTKRLDEITSFALEHIKSELLKSGLSPATVKHVLVLVRQIYNKAVVWGMYKGMNPIKGVKLPALQNQREKVSIIWRSENAFSMHYRKAQARFMIWPSLSHTGMRPERYSIFGAMT